MVEPTHADQDFAQEWTSMLADKDDMALTLGIVPKSRDAQSVVLTMSWSAAISQPSGLFSAAALFGLADIAGTFLALQHSSSGGFPLAVQSNVHLLGNVNEGTVEATATLIKGGRTFIVTTTQVIADHGKLLASVQTTYLNPT